MKIWSVVLVSLLCLSASADSRLDRVARQMGTQVQVDPSSLPNAYARADGRIFVTQGLLGLVRNDDQLAFIVGHEMAHLERRHHKKQFRSTLGGFILGAGIAALTKGSPRGIRNAGLAGAGLLGSKRSRVSEYDADKVGLALMTEAGYDPRQAPAAMELLQGRGSAGVPVLGWFASHPDTGNRVRRLRELATPRSTPGVAGRDLVQEPLVSVGPVGPLFVLAQVANLDGYGSGYYYSGRFAKMVALATEALVNQGFDVVEREYLEVVLREQNLGSTDWFDEARVARVGRLVGAKQLFVLVLTDAHTDTTIDGGIRMGRFSRGRSIDVSTEHRRLKIVARLVDVEKGLAVWSSARKGGEGTIIGTYRDAGLFNGFGIRAGHDDRGSALSKAVAKLVSQLRADVQPALAVSTSPRSSDDRVDIPDLPETPAYQVEKAEEFSFTLVGISAYPGQVWCYGSGSSYGEVVITRVEGTRAYSRLQTGAPPQKGLRCYPKK